MRNHADQPGRLGDGPVAVVTDRVATGGGCSDSSCCRNRCVCTMASAQRPPNRGSGSTLKPPEAGGEQAYCQPKEQGGLYQLEGPEAVEGLVVGQEADPLPV